MSSNRKCFYGNKGRFYLLSLDLDRVICSKTPNRVQIREHKMPQNRHALPHEPSRALADALYVRLAPLARFAYTVILHTSSSKSEGSVAAFETNMMLSNAFSAQESFSQSFTCLQLPTILNEENSFCTSAGNVNSSPSGLLVLTVNNGSEKSLSPNTCTRHSVGYKKSNVGTCKLGVAAQPRKTCGLLTPGTWALTVNLQALSSRSEGSEGMFSVNNPLSGLKAEHPSWVQTCTLSHLCFGTSTRQSHACMRNG